MSVHKQVYVGPYLHVKVGKMKVITKRLECPNKVAVPPTCKGLNFSPGERPRFCIRCGGEVVRVKTEKSRFPDFYDLERSAGIEDNLHNIYDNEKDELNLVSNKHMYITVEGYGDEILISDSLMDETRGSFTLHHAEDIKALRALDFVKEAEIRFGCIVYYS